MFSMLCQREHDHPSVRLGRAARLAIVPVLAALLLGGCTPKYYAPNTHNVPLLQQKGDGVLSVAAGDGRAEIQGAYAVTRHVGLMLNTAFFDPEDDEEGDGGQGQLVEAGLGYHRGLSSNIVFETYGLIGVGTVKNHFPSTLTTYPSTTGKIESQLVRVGIQPAIGFTSKYVDVAVSTRLSGLSYSDISGSLVFAGEDQVDYLRREDTHWLIEPAVTVRAGFDALKLHLQLGRSFNLSNTDFRQDDGHVTIGLGYHLNK